MLSGKRFPPSAPVFVEGLGGSARPALPARGVDSAALLRLARDAARTLRVSRVGIWRFAGAEGEVVALARFDRRLGVSLDSLPLPAGAGASLRTLLTRVTSLAVADTARAGREGDALKEWILAEEIGAILLLPLRIDGEIVGMVSWEEVGGPREWSGRDRDFAAAFGHQARTLLEANQVRPSASSVAAPTVALTVSPTASGAAPRVPAAALPPDITPPPTPLPRVGRLTPLEGGAVLAEEASETTLWQVEVQRGYLQLLTEALADRPDDLLLLEEARGILEGIDEGVRSSLLFMRGGVPGGAPIDLGAAMGKLLPTLVTEGGDHVRLLLSPGVGPFPVRGDSRLLEAALRAVVRAARLASPEGGRVRLAWGRVHATPQHEVPDNGFRLDAVRIRCGYQVMDGAAPTRALTPLVRAVIEGHGGWVEEAVSEEGERLLDLYLPLTPPAVTTVNARSGAGRTTARRILVVEDEPLLARLLQRTLTRAGYLVELAASITAGDRLWRHLDGEFDLVVAECGLAGGASGADLVRRLRDECPSLPVILLDRKGDSATGETIAALGGAPVLQRPFEPADILGEVRVALPIGNGASTGTGADAGTRGVATPSSDSSPDVVPPAHPLRDIPGAGLRAH